MGFVVWLILASAWGQTLEAPDNDLPVFVRPSTTSRVMFYTNRGETLHLKGKKGEFTRIVVRRAGKSRVGYIYTADLYREPPDRRRGWAFGVGGHYSYLTQGGKNFTTEDDVTYTTTSFSSATSSPFLSVQTGRQNFWRFTGTFRLTDYSTQATTNVSGGQPRDATVRHKMFSVTIQKAWSKKWFYFGLGAEMSRALGAEVTIGGVKVPTPEEDLPTYWGVLGMVGIPVEIAHNRSLMFEFKPVLYANQSPMIMGAEMSFAFQYWP